MPPFSWVELGDQTVTLTMASSRKCWVLRVLETVREKTPSVTCRFSRTDTASF